MSSRLPGTETRLTDAQVLAQRKRAVRDYRRVQRKADTQMEKIERQVFSQLDNKRYIGIGFPHYLAGHQRKLIQLVNEMTKALADMLIIFTN